MKLNIVMDFMSRMYLFTIRERRSILATQVLSFKCLNRTSSGPRGELDTKLETRKFGRKSRKMRKKFQDLLNQDHTPLLLYVLIDYSQFKITCLWNLFLSDNYVTLVVILENIISRRIFVNYLFNFAFNHASMVLFLTIVKQTWTFYPLTALLCQNIVKKYSLLSPIQGQSP